MIRDLKTYKAIREDKFSGRSGPEKDQLLNDLLRDLVEFSCGEGIQVAFKREFQAYFKALNQANRAHHWAAIYEKLRGEQ